MMDDDPVAFSRSCFFKQDKRGGNSETEAGYFLFAFDHQTIGHKWINLFRIKKFVEMKQFKKIVFQFFYFHYCQASQIILKSQKVHHGPTLASNKLPSISLAVAMIFSPAFSRSAFVRLVDILSPVARK